MYVSAEIVNKEEVGKGGVDALKLDWPQLVPDTELEDRLKAVSDWQLSQDRSFISRRFQTRDFSEGWVFISPHFHMSWFLVLNDQYWVILLGVKSFPAHTVWNQTMRRLYPHSWKLHSLLWAGIKFFNSVAQLAEEAGHHPVSDSYFKAYSPWIVTVLWLQKLDFVL